MSDQLYKVVLRRPTNDNPLPLLASTVNRVQAALLIRQACSWLIAEGKEGHLNICYNNADEHQCQTTVVLTDRNTALMLKLALG